MLNLILSTDKLQLGTSTAATIDVHVSFADLSGTTVTPGKQNTAIAVAAAATDICAAPGGGAYRNVKTIHVRNKDASLACDVTVIYDANGTDYELFKGTLGTQEELEYIEGIGFFTIVSTAKLNKCLYVTANSVHATAATFAAITGLTTPVLSGHSYTVLAMLNHISNATTTGAQFAFGGVAMTAMIIGSMSVVTVGAVTTTMSSGVATAVNTAPVVQTTGSAANAPTYLAGWFQPSADGTFEVRATSEVTVANGLTVLKGSWAVIRETDN